ncbi:hypothetical protein JCM10207_003832 [Rhodosporidiobolus poonsookiae]
MDSSLLSQIQAGKGLKKVQTNDRSQAQGVGAVLDASGGSKSSAPKPPSAPRPPGGASGGGDDRPQQLGGLFAGVGMPTLKKTGAVGASTMLNSAPAEQCVAFSTNSSARTSRGTPSRSARCASARTASATSSRTVGSSSRATSSATRPAERASPPSRCTASSFYWTSRAAARRPPSASRSRRRASPSAPAPSPSPSSRHALSAFPRRPAAATVSALPCRIRRFAALHARDAGAPFASDARPARTEGAPTRPGLAQRAARPAEPPAHRAAHARVSSRARDPAAAA